MVVRLYMKPFQVQSLSRYKALEAHTPNIPPNFLHWSCDGRVDRDSRGVIASARGRLSKVDFDVEDPIYRGI